MTFTQILAEARRLTGTSSNSFTTADITTSANKALNRLHHLISEVDGSWLYGDSNNASPAIDTSLTVTSGTQQYAIPSGVLDIDRIEIKDSSGNWHKLEQIDDKTIPDALVEYMNGDSIPAYYDLREKYIYLYPTPNYTQTNSIKIYYMAAPHPFETNDTTAEAGFDSTFHYLIPLWVAYDYARIKLLPNREEWFREIVQGERQLQRHYKARNKEGKEIMTPKKNLFI